jgi:integrase
VDVGPQRERRIGVPEPSGDLLDVAADLEQKLKTSSGKRDLPLAPGMARALWAAHPANGQGPMFRTSTGTRYADRNVRRVLDAATKRAGLEWVHFHTFRHTCASM